MTVYPQNGYDKDSFVLFLEENNISDNVVEKFKTLPKSIICKKITYDLNLGVSWFDLENTFYNFEINYYCDDQIEFLFSHKIFKDVELSIDHAIIELKKLKLI